MKNITLWLLACIGMLFMMSCSVMNSNIMIGATSEYEDHVWCYIENIDYYQRYDIKLIFSADEIFLK